MSMNNTKLDILYLSEQDMIAAGVKDMSGCIEAMEEMFKLLKIGDYRMGGANGNSHGVMMMFPDVSPFPNMPVNGPDRRFMAMPAYLGGKFDMAGMKWYGSNGENRKKGLPRSILMLMLNDKETGAPLAYMSANILSAYRTGAVPGVGVKYFAKEDTKVVGIVGPGVMSKTCLAAIVTARPGIETVKIKGRGQGSLQEFTAYIRREYPQIRQIQVMESIEETVRGSDVICLCTSSSTGDPSSYPYIHEEWIQPGALFICPAAARFDEEFMLNRVRNVADNIQLYRAWAEEFAYPSYHTIPIPAVYCMDLMHEGKMKHSDVDDLGDVLVGNVPVHRKKDEIIVYSVGGMPVEDVAWGTICYRNALERGVGTELNLWEAPVLK
jgi:ornithine cyclodeaminase/alanine dehydrogenase-like protein (mu-crystallin family)